MANKTVKLVEPNLIGATLTMELWDDTTKIGSTVASATAGNGVWTFIVSAAVTVKWYTVRLFESSQLVAWGWVYFPSGDVAGVYDVTYEKTATVAGSLGVPINRGNVFAGSTIVDSLSQAAAVVDLSDCDIAIKLNNEAVNAALFDTSVSATTETIEFSFTVPVNLQEGLLRIDIVKPDSSIVATFTYVLQPYLSTDPGVE